VRTQRQRNSDIKLVLAATAAVLAGGLLIAAALVVATRGGDDAHCGRLPAGAADDLRTELEDGGPQYQTGGGACGYWLALDEGDIVAYRAKQPDGCTLHYDDGAFRCGAQRPDAADIARYPVTIETVDGVDAVFVNLEPRVTPST
jgi:hypothetical protein